LRRGCHSGFPTHYFFWAASCGGSTSPYAGNRVPARSLSSAAQARYVGQVDLGSSRGMRVHALAHRLQCTSSAQLPREPVRRASSRCRVGVTGLRGSENPRTRGVAAADTRSSRPNRADKQQRLTDLTAVAAVTAMRNGDLKAQDYAGALLDRAQHLESLNAFRTLAREMVLEAARAADKVRVSGEALGALHGLPIPVKDSVNSKALPTSNGTRALRDFRPRGDAGVLKSLLAQGGILMGKTNIHELSYGWTSNNGIFGPVHNPYDPTRVPGGSSGGCRAAGAAP